MGRPGDFSVVANRPDYYGDRIIFIQFFCEGIGV